MKNSSSSTKPRGKGRVTKKEFAVTHFCELRRVKSSMEEIAKELGVSTAFLYGYVIPEVSERYGIPKDDLLFQPHAAPVFTKKPGRPKGTGHPIDSEESDMTYSNIDNEEINSEGNDTNNPERNRPEDKIMAGILRSLSDARKIAQEMEKIIEEAKKIWQMQ